MCDTYYCGIGPNAGKVVPADEALEYALEECGLAVDARAPAAREFLDMLPDWFFSGNWVKEGENIMENNNSAAVAVPPVEKKTGMPRVALRHVGLVQVEYGNIWLWDGLGGTDKTLAAIINDALMANGIDSLNGLAELVLTIEPLVDVGTDVEVV